MCSCKYVNEYGVLVFRVASLFNNYNLIIILFIEHKVLCHRLLGAIVPSLISANYDRNQSAIEKCNKICH